MEIQGLSSKEGVEMLSNHRHLRWMLYASVMTVMGALVVVGPVGAAEAQSATPRTNVAVSTATPGGVTLQTQETKLTPADRNLVVAVRLAGLWEIPAGQMAITKGVSPRVRQIGQMIASQHVRLDALDQAAAKEVGVELPDRPTDQQTRWLNEMKAAKGADFDQIYVMRLRAAHGNIFPVIAAVRSSTHNDAVRKLAQDSNNFVLTHITLLESTGLVQYEELAKAKAPPIMPANAAQSSQSSGLATSAIWILLAGALIAGAFFTTRMVRPQTFGGLPNRHRQRDSEYQVSPRTVVPAADNYYPQDGLRLGSGSRSR
jgi:predicted outer membrane protein